MRLRFACPSCSAAGAVDAALAGRSARCKHCGARFTIPTPETVDDDVYDLREPIVTAHSPELPEPDSAFVSSRGEETVSSDRPHKRKRATAPAARQKRKAVPERAWGRWLASGVVAVVCVLAAVALIVPKGTVLVGCTLLIIGCVMILAGYGAGAFGAFCEDFLYGMLYLLVPLYAGYYLLTRWDDLWVWFTCATIGVGLVLFGTELLRWSGVAG